MAHAGFDEQMNALDALKDRALDADGIALIGKSIGSRNNFIVARAARLVEDNALTSLVPQLIAAFDRFFANPEKTDPQCWAKNALSRALSKLQCRDKDIFLRELHHHQMEPTWGGRSDSAGTLRANCAFALAQTRSPHALDALLQLHRNPSYRPCLRDWQWRTRPREISGCWVGRMGVTR